MKELLSCIENTIEISAEEKRLVEELFKLKKIKKGDFFLEEGKICKQVGFIKKGIVRYYINDDGRERTYSFSKEGIL